ncbi:alpha-glycosidase, partial [bacterium]
IRLRVKKRDIESAFLIATDRHFAEDTLPMPFLCTESPFEYYEIGVPIEDYISYRFLVFDGARVALFPPGDVEFEITPNEPPVFVTPQWSRGALFYQIFPERFANGNPQNDPKNVVPWGSTPEHNNFMGGDLDGVIEHLPYLDSLGVGAIYFNPIFEAGSNHKYDTHDYYAIDDNFGDDELFRSLESAAEARDIKIVLDGVFNHIGFGSPIFQDVVEKGSESDYADWFFVHDYPVQGPENPNYECWWGFGSLPKLNTDNSSVREYLFGAIRKWTELGADGWRLDVAPDVPHRFWKAFRDSIRAINPEAYSIGEIWGDGTPWLGGDEFDAVMNYRFRDACVEFFAKSNITPEDFLDRLGGYLADYPQPTNAVILNLLGSHDTPRFLTIAHNESWRLRLALFWTLIWPGAPCIYYGDEIGMTGDKDPGCRKAFPWDKPTTWNTETLQMVGYISSLRKRNRCLRDGTFRPLFIDNGAKVLAIERRFEDELAVVAVNLSAEKYDVAVELLAENEFAPADNVPFPAKKLGRATEAFSGERYYDPSPLEFTIPARDMVLFIVR